MNYKLVTVNDEYLKYLSKFDDRLSLTYGSLANKFYMGIIININNNLYFLPLVSKILGRDRWNIKIDTKEKIMYLNTSLLIPINENLVHDLNYQTYTEIERKIIFNSNDIINKKINYIKKLSNKRYYNKNIKNHPNINFLEEVYITY